MAETRNGLFMAVLFPWQCKKNFSCTDIASVEGTRNGGIARAFDDRAAVGEDGEFVRRHAKTQKEIVAANSGDGFLDAPAQFAEIEAAAAFMDLHGIAAAQGDVGLRFAFEISEVATNAGAALRIPGDADGLEAARPNIARDEAAIERFGFSRKKLGCFRSFDGGDNTGGAVQDACGVASFLEAEAAPYTVGCAIRFKQASEARGFARKNRESETVTGNSRSVNPGNSESDCGIIDKEASFEVVGAVENQGEAGKQLASVFRV
jgi:hypothetical protein